MPFIAENIQKAQEFINQGQFHAAEGVLAPLLHQGNISAALYQKLAVAVALQERVSEAIDLFEKSIETDPSFSLSYNGLAFALSKENRFKEAEEICKKGLELDPDCLPLYSTYTKILKDQSRLTEAEKIIKSGLERSPDDPNMLINLGAISNDLENKEQALECFERASQAQPLNMELHEFIAKNKTYINAQDEHLLKMQELLKDPRIQKRNKGDLHFALAYAFNNLKDYKTAYNHYLIANDLVSAEFNYSHANTINLFNALKTAYDKNYFEKHIGAEIKDETPIFIVGMPRSGTSLVEQILASHSDVFGAGELPTIHDMTFKQLGFYASNHSEKLKTPSEEEAQSLAQKYLTRIKEFAPRAVRITDKMPHNFRSLGLIQTLFPKAKIIHCVRNKNDVMHSIFKQNFKANIPFAFNHQNIHNFYEEYEDLMQHWHRVLPHPIMTLRYEDLISNQEKVSKELLSFCELEWQDSCLEFYKTQRSVTTASARQVRQPLYNTAVGSWKIYQDFLPSALFKEEE